VKPSSEYGVIFVADTTRTIVDQVREWMTDSPDPCEVHGFASGRELLRRLDYQSPDLLISDVNLPQFDALTALRTLRGSQIPVVLTAQDSRDDARLAVEGLLAGAADVWHKRRRQGSLRLAMGHRPFLRKTALVLQPAAEGPAIQSSCRWLRLDASDDRVQVGCAYSDLLPGRRRLTLAMGNTNTTARLFGSLLLPDQSASPLVVRLPHAASFGPALQEALSRRWNRAVLELEKTERVRCGQWRLLPGRSVLEVSQGGKPDDGGTIAGWGPNRLVDEERSSCAQLERLQDAPPGSLAVLLTELPGPTMLTPLVQLLARDQLVLLHVQAVRDAWHSLSPELDSQRVLAFPQLATDGLLRRSS